MNFNPLNFIGEPLETHTCCICGKKFKGHGHLPTPIKDDGLCCDECNINVVMKRNEQLENEGSGLK